MFDTLPKSALDALDWVKEDYQPFFDNLIERDVVETTIEQWLADWSMVSRLAYEAYTRMIIATNVDTTDEAAQKRLNAFLDGVYPLLMNAQNMLNKKLLDSGLEPEALKVPLRNIRTSVELFREENIPLKTEEQKLDMAYDKLISAQTVQWDGQEITLEELKKVYYETDRDRREKAWRLAMARRLEDREALNALWIKYMGIRGKIAANADQKDYRAYQWKAKNRHDYTTDNAETFHESIETVVVPAMRDQLEKKRAQLGVDTLRPWDEFVDPKGRAPLKPYETIEEMNSTLETIFTRVDPVLGNYFKVMRDENLLDLDNRKGKAPGGYCTDLPVAQRPFIFMNAVGLHDDVQTLLHEGGHAFHAFESLKLPYEQQQEAPMEFCEVASMAMELLGAPYLTKSKGGFYSDEDAAHARAEHLSGVLGFWPYMAVVDAFQHWVYTNHQAASDPVNCDAKWGELWDRFMPVYDYEGFEDIKVTGWQRKLHIFQAPFYYIEYGLAQLGAVQVWANSLIDDKKAIRQYREALALGGTATLPDLFETAGAKLGFDVGTMSGAISLINMTLEQLG